MKQLFAAVLAATIMTLPAWAGAPLRIHFKNASKLTITELYVEIVTAEMGSERLKGKPIPPKGKLQVLLDDGANKCVVDVLIRVKEGKEFNYRAQLCQNHEFIFRGRL
ncbi:hypothetical protein [Devosia sp. CN2-171]|jgi:hypothetical protein|uniref:hypothetical protein n=1 Tax=Devosia sp. CN2-171 TaxID=3400909 RepID=UPI003BF92483